MTTDTATEARFVTRDLPYAYDALAPHISEETMRYHHDKHYTGYVAKLNELALDTPFAQQPLEDIVVSSDGALFNNAARRGTTNFSSTPFRPPRRAFPPASSPRPSTSTSDRSRTSRLR